MRKWMVEAGLWLSRKQRRSFHQPRLRRESYDELIQIDGSEDRWFEGRGEPCRLLVFIDDATSSLMQLRFVLSESTSSDFEVLRSYLETHGCPVAFYSDSQCGRYGYRRITALLKRAGWQVGKDRVEGIWRREGLKVPQSRSHEDVCGLTMGRACG